MASPGACLRAPGPSERPLTDCLSPPERSRSHRNGLHHLSGSLSPPYRPRRSERERRRWIVCPHRSAACPGRTRDSAVTPWNAGEADRAGGFQAVPPAGMSPCAKWKPGGGRAGRPQSSPELRFGPHSMGRASPRKRKQPPGGCRGVVSLQATSEGTSAPEIFIPREVTG